jgi:gamma-glutamyltranspeptidase
VVWHDGKLHGLNGSGRSPRELDEIRVDGTGPRSVTVPGVVRAWADLADRFGRLGLDRALSRAAELAARGVACTPRIADKWARAVAAPYPAPAVGERFVIPDLAISLIQSVYETFGSGIVAPGTGVVLQNRAAGFVDDAGHPNRLAPSRRPFHTIIPGMLLEGGRLLGPFGVMGGGMQPQGHLQTVLRLVDHGDDPQAALDAPRWRVGEGREVHLEPGLWSAEDDLAKLGHDVRRATVQHRFGVAQAILRLGDALIGGSDGRGDGVAVGL